MLDKQVGAYTVAEEIGRGSFAVVSKGYHVVLPYNPLQPALSCAEPFRERLRLMLV